MFRWHLSGKLRIQEGIARQFFLCDADHVGETAHSMQECEVSISVSRKSRADSLPVSGMMSERCGGI